MGHPVILQHGILSNSVTFMVNEERSLAFWLLEQGYDVYCSNIVRLPFFHPRLVLIGLCSEPTSRCLTDTYVPRCLQAFATLTSFAVPSQRPSLLGLGTSVLPRDYFPWLASIADVVHRRRSRRLASTTFPPSSTTCTSALSSSPPILAIPREPEPVRSHLIRRSQKLTSHAVFLALSRGMRPDMGNKISSFIALGPAVYAGPVFRHFPFSLMRRFRARAIWSFIFGGSSPPPHLRKVAVADRLSQFASSFPSFLSSRASSLAGYLDISPFLSSHSSCVFLLCASEAVLTSIRVQFGFHDHNWLNRQIPKFFRTVAVATSSELLYCAFSLPSLPQKCTLIPFLASTDYMSNLSRTPRLPPRTGSR